MKTMTCKQLAGACDMEFHAETFKKMVAKGDNAHIEKMEEMKDLMNKPEAVKEWFEKLQKKPSIKLDFFLQLPRRYLTRTLKDILLNPQMIGWVNFIGKTQTGGIIMPMQCGELSVIIQYGF